MKTKLCKVCNATYTSTRPLQRCCDVSCAIEYNHRVDAKSRERASKRALRARRDNARPLSWYHKRAQAEFNKFIRLRDRDLGCVSCDKPATWGGQWHASHYRPRGGAGSAMRYLEVGCAKSCSECNNHKSGNLTAYRVELIKRIGLPLVEWLETQNAPCKWTRQELEYVREHYRLKCKELINCQEFE